LETEARLGLLDSSEQGEKEERRVWRVRRDSEEIREKEETGA
jgi:hypothetical protein